MVFLDDWISDEKLLKTVQAIDQPVTSFVVARDLHFEIRWFSMAGEINLCGHGSLAAGAALMNAHKLNEVLLLSAYGDVRVSAQDGLYQIRLPGWHAQPFGLTQAIKKMGLSPVDVFTTRDLVVVVRSEQEVLNFVPDVEQLKQIEDYHAFILTAKSSEDEYVLRYFAPKIGIPEDLATGSAHCSLAPYWFGKLGTDKLQARQLSNAGGYFNIENGPDESIVVSAMVKKRVG